MKLETATPGKFPSNLEQPRAAKIPNEKKLRSQKKLPEMRQLNCNEI